MAHKRGRRKRASEPNRDKTHGKPRKGAPSSEPINYRQLKAVAHPLRMRILAILIERVASPKEISGELDETLSTVSYHVRVLRDGDLIVGDSKARRRGAIEHFYRAAVPTLIPPDAWKNIPPTARNAVSRCIVREFLDDVEAAMEAGVFDESPAELTWTPLVLDSAGLREVATLAREFIQAVHEVQANASRRLAGKKKGRTGKARSATIFLANFLSARNPEDEKKSSAAKRL